MPKFLQASFCLAAGFASAMFVSLVSYFAFWPSRLDRLASTHLVTTAILGAIWASGLGLVILFTSALRRPLSPAICAVVAAITLLAATLWRTVHPWQYYGHFPAWMLQRDFLQFLPSALAAGLVFGLVARRLAPDNSSKPTPLRGAA